MPEIICVSVTAETKKVFDELRRRKPVGTAFSKSLKLIVEDYLRGDQNVFECDFNSILLSSNIEVWQKLIKSISVEEFKKLQIKAAQIDVLINKRVEKCLN